VVLYLPLFLKEALNADISNVRNIKIQENMKRNVKFKMLTTYVTERIIFCHAICRHVGFPFPCRHHF